MNALVIQEFAVARGNGATKFLGISLAGLEMECKEELLADHGALGPDVVGGKDAKFLDGKTLENRFDVFRINVLTFLGDDHVFLAAEELQMAGGIESTEIAGHQPSVDDGFAGEFGLIQIAGHDCFAADSNLADSVGAWIDDADLHAGQWLADSVCAERLEIVDGDRCARFGQTIAVRHRNAQIVKELQRSRLGEGTADYDRA